MMRRICGVVVATILTATGLVGITTGVAEAHSIGLSGTPECVPSDGSWKVKVKVDVTNTPNTGNDSQSETKVLKPTGNPYVSKDGGMGVMAGSQVMLNAWYEHRNNWPGVKTRVGNYSDYYTIYVPANVNSVETEVQIDWKNWGSADPKKTFYKPSNCVPYDECKDLPGTQPKDFRCTPNEERRFRTVEGSPDCTSKTVPIFNQSQYRKETFTPPTTWTMPDWPTTWTTDSTSTRTTTEQECPTPPCTVNCTPGEPPCTVDCTPVEPPCTTNCTPVEPPCTTNCGPAPKTYFARFHARSVKNCDPKLADVYVDWRKNIDHFTFKKISKWKVRVTGFAKVMPDGTQSFFKDGTTTHSVIKSMRLKNQKKCTSTS